MKTTQKTYVATEGDIRKLARAVATGMVVIEGGWDTYFKFLVGTTQAGLAAAGPVDKSRKLAPLPADKTVEQVATLREVHSKWLGIVNTELRAKGFKGNALHLRTARFRSSASVLLAYLRRGRDVAKLNAATVTKNRIEAANAKARGIDPDAVKPGLLAKRLHTGSTVLTDQLRRLASVDKEQAISLAEAQLTALTGLMEELAKAPDTSVAAPALVAPREAQGRQVAFGKTVHIAESRVE